MTTAIEFTDRYGGHAPSWLRACHGDCEATGYYPVKGHERDDLPPGSAQQWSRWPTPRERQEIERRIARGQRQPDGWYILMCPACQGTGQVSWLVTIARLPLWVLRGLHSMWEFRPGGPFWDGHPSSWAHRLRVNFHVAFLCDLGWPI